MEEKKYFLKVNGGNIEVTEEVYREYMRPEWCKDKRNLREFRCRDASGNRCAGDCDSCPYALDGGKLRGGTISLDALMDEEDGDGFDVVDPDVDVEREAERDELREAFARAREKLSEKEGILLDMLLDDRTESQIAERLDVSVGAVRAMKDRLYKKFRILMKDYADLT